MAASFAAVSLDAATPRDPIPVDMAEASLEREAQAALEIGLRVADEQTETLRGTSDRDIELALEPDECIAVVAAASGMINVEDIVVETREVATVELTRASNPRGVTRHVQWCAERAQTLHAVVRLSSRAGLGGNPGGVLRYKVHRGRPTALFDALNRGVPTAEGGRSVSRPRLLAIADRHVQGRTPLGPPIEINDYRARLVPENATTFAELHRLAANGNAIAVTPRWDPLPPDAPDRWRPLAVGAADTRLDAISGALSLDEDADHPAVAFRDDTGRRVLVVINPRDLGATCVEVQLVRLLYGYQAQVEDARGTPLTRARHLAYRRALCPGAGPIAFVVPPDDRETYLLRLYAR